MKYNINEIKIASEKAKSDLLSGKLLTTDHRETNIVQNGENDPFRMTVLLKYKLDDINFLERNNYLNKK